MDYYFAPSGVVVDLKAGTASGFGNDTVTGIQDVEGTTHDDIIIGNGADNFLQGYEVTTRFVAEAATTGSTATKATTDSTAEPATTT